MPGTFQSAVPVLATPAAVGAIPRPDPGDLQPPPRSGIPLLAGGRRPSSRPGSHNTLSENGAPLLPSEAPSPVSSALGLVPQRMRVSQSMNNIASAGVVGSGTHAVGQRLRSDARPTAEQRPDPATLRANYDLNRRRAASNGLAAGTSAAGTPRPRDPPAEVARLQRRTGRPAAPRRVGSGASAKSTASSRSSRSPGSNALPPRPEPALPQVPGIKPASAPPTARDLHANGSSPHQSGSGKTMAPAPRQHGPTRTARRIASRVTEQLHTPPPRVRSDAPRVGVPQSRSFQSGLTRALGGLSVGQRLGHQQKPHTPQAAQNAQAHGSGVVGVAAAGAVTAHVPHVHARLQHTAQAPHAPHAPQGQLAQHTQHTAEPRGRPPVAHPQHVHQQPSPHHASPQTARGRAPRHTHHRRANSGSETPSLRELSLENSNHDLPIPRGRLAGISAGFSALSRDSSRDSSRGPKRRSAASSRTSIRSTTRKLFSRIRSGTSSRASSMGSGDLAPLAAFPRAPTPIEDWIVEPIDKPPSSDVLAAFRQVVPPPEADLPPAEDVDPAAKYAPLTGTRALDTLDLTDFEQTEVLEYRDVYYAGPPSSEKRTGELDDDQGNYKPAAHDHIGYRYEIMSELGRGSFGTVYKCRDHKTGRAVAIKVTANRKGLSQQTSVEASLLRQLTKNGSPDKHHVLRYIDHFVFRNHMCIATEMLSFNLYDLLRATSYKGLNVGIVRYIARQLVEGLEYLDDQGIIHCDLKPENVLLSDLNACQVKIIDFGSGCLEARRVFTYIQSRFYRAPEILLGLSYGTAIDMWSLGCIVAELVIGKPLFPGEDEPDQVACICEVIGVPDPSTLRMSSRGSKFFDARGEPLRRRSPKGIVRGLPATRPLATLLPPAAADFVGQMLQWSPQRRISAGGALYHDFVFGQ